MYPQNIYPMLRRDDEQEGDDQNYRRAKQYFPDTYLDSPILLTTREKWIRALSTPEDASKKNPTMLERSVRDVRLTGVDWTEYEIVDPDQYPIHYHHDWQSTIESSLGSSLEVAQGLYSLIVKSLKSRLV